MSIPKYLMVLANHKGPAIVKVGGMALPVKIMDIEHESKLGESDMTTFKCLVVNEDQIGFYDNQKAKQVLNSAYGRPNPEYVNYSVSDVRSTMAAYAMMSEAKRFEIDRVIFSNPATIVFWADGTKTVVKCQDSDTYSEETGLAMAIAKKVFGNKGNFNEVFKKFIPGYGKGEAADEVPEV